MKRYKFSYWKSRFLWGLLFCFWQLNVLAQDNTTQHKSNEVQIMLAQTDHSTSQGVTSQQTRENREPDYVKQLFFTIVPIGLLILVSVLINKHFRKDLYK